MGTNTSKGKGHTIGLIISLGISGAILAYLFAKLEWDKVGAYLQRINLLYIPLLLFMLIGLGWLRALRWKLLLPNRDTLSTLRLFEGTQIGFFASFVLPLRAGEIIRPWFLSKFQPVSFSAALASILTERLSDAVCLLALMVISLSRLESVPPVIMAGAQALAALTAVLVVIVVLSYLLPGKVEKVFHRIVGATAGRFFPHAADKINHMINEYFQGLRSIRSFRDLALVMFWSFAMWSMMAVWYQLALWAFGEHPSWWVGMVLNVMIALAVAAPSAPGFIGTFQVGCILALSTAYGFSKEFAVAFSVVTHLVQFVFNVTVGLIILNVRGLQLAQLRKTANREAGPGAG